MKTFLNISLITLILVVLASSCRKGELPVSRPSNKNINTVEIVTGVNYDRQVYFNLLDNEEVGTSHRNDWDLGFSCSDTPYIVCNTGRMMTAMLVEDNTFEQLTSKGDFENNQKLDHSTGRIDSLAIRGGSLFLINRGIGVDADAKFIKLEIIEHTKTLFKGRIANLDGSNEQTVSISKNTEYNFVYLKWDKSEKCSTPIVEPKKTEWDIVFTQYGYIFYQPAMLYSVMGCLTNSYNTKALKILPDDKKFEEVNLAYAQTLDLLEDKDVIGYDWKSVHGVTATPTWTIQYDNTYIIKDQNDIYYKLRFIGFNNPTTGEKGTPVFEYMALF